MQPVMVGLISRMFTSWFLLLGLQFQELQLHIKFMKMLKSGLNLPTPFMVIHPLLFKLVNVERRENIFR